MLENMSSLLCSYCHIVTSHVSVIAENKSQGYQDTIYLSTLIGISNSEHDLLPTAKSLVPAAIIVGMAWHQCRCFCSSYSSEQYSNPRMTKKLPQRSPNQPTLYSFGFGAIATKNFPSTSATPIDRASVSHHTNNDAGGSPDTAIAIWEDDEIKSENEESDGKERMIESTHADNDIEAQLKAQLEKIHDEHCKQQSIRRRKVRDNSRHYEAVHGTKEYNKQRYKRIVSSPSRMANRNLNRQLVEIRRTVKRLIEHNALRTQEFLTLTKLSTLMEEAHNIVR